MLCAMKFKWQFSNQINDPCKYAIPLHYITICNLLTKILKTHDIVAILILNHIILIISRPRLHGYQQLHRLQHVRHPAVSGPAVADQVAVLPRHPRPSLGKSSIERNVRNY